MKIYLASLALAVASLSAVSPEEALKKLKEGNVRYLQDKMIHCDRNTDRRESTATSQNPFATILGCSDSRVPPATVFDQGIGDLFIVRVAGNVLGPIEIDSIDYSVVHLGSKLIVVLGHENCGAVKAVLANQTADIKTIASMIWPALSPKEENLTAAIKANVKHVVGLLRRNPVFSKLVQEGKVQVVGAYYNLNSGEVEFLP